MAELETADRRSSSHSGSSSCSSIPGGLKIPGGGCEVAEGDSIVVSVFVAFGEGVGLLWKCMVSAFDIAAESVCISSSFRLAREYSSTSRILRSAFVSLDN